MFNVQCEAGGMWYYYDCYTGSINQGDHWTPAISGERMTAGLRHLPEMQNIVHRSRKSNILNWYYTLQK